MALERHEATTAATEETDDVERPIDLEVRLMYLANEGDLDRIKELLDSGVNVNFKATQLSMSQPAMDSPTSFPSCLTVAVNSIPVIA
nr:hypothetical protein CFP56_72893 [Quercus suber]